MALSTSACGGENETPRYITRTMTMWKKLLWIAVTLLGLGSIAILAMSRGEQINALWIIIAGLCAFAISYRFYSKWLASKVLLLNDERATPALVQNDGKDFVPTNRWMVFGHHFAAIAGPGPLVGPVLAAQFGFLPGTLWILIGATLGGGVHDMIILFASVRRRGKTLGQMVKEEIGRGVGALALISVLAIMIILLAVLALVVVQALAKSPWGVFTIAMTIPIALLMGAGLRSGRFNVSWITAFGIMGLFFAVWGGQFLGNFPALEAWFRHSDRWLAWAIMAYGLAASILPVWMLLEGEFRIRDSGYGAMITEMMVALMAMIAACVIQPGEYFAINTKGTPMEVVAKVSAAGFPVTELQMADLARNLGEQTMFNRAGGAPTFAVGMAHMFARVSAGPTALALWYHFAIMFEALFILTTIDAGTRVGRFLLQDLLGNLWRPLGNTRSWIANSFASMLLVAAWGWFLYQGVIDPLGGINTLWPLFGLANQLLSVIALCLGTTLLIKMGKARYLVITIVPLLFMAVVTFSAGYMKIFSPDPNLGLLAGAQSAIQRSVLAADPNAAAVLVRQATMYRIDVFVAASFLLLVLLIVIGSAVEWYRLLVGHKRVQLHESEFVPLAEVATS